MKKITFFVAVMLSLNAGIVVRKDDEENSIHKAKHCTAQNKKGTALWLQQFVKQLKYGFYLINNNGQYQKINLIKSNERFLFQYYKKIKNNRFLYNYFEINKAK